MRKTLLYSFTLLLIVACSSAKSTQKAINTGNYDKAINLALQKLRNNKTKKGNQQYVYMLEEAFAKVTERDLGQISFLQSESNPENLEQIYKLYVALNNRQERIRPLLPLPIIETGKNAKFTFNNYSADLITSKENLSSYLYNQAVGGINTNDKNSLRSIYYNLEYLEEINPNYKDVRTLMNEVHAKGIDYVFVSVNNDSEKVIPLRLEEDLLNFDTYGLNDLWTVYHSSKSADINYDFGLELNLRTIEVSPERIKEKEVHQEKLIKDGFTYVVDDNGNRVKDSLGNQIKVDKMITVKCELLEIGQLKTSLVAGQVQFVDFNANQVLQTFPIESEFVFEHYYATYNGDRRAVNGSYIEWITLKAAPFPTNEQMIYDTGTDLKARLKSIITQNKFRN
ncbi:hypothetical protein [Urechidicola vernalis]|uniref:Lipoprotein n=1 Tax=Urechidicola vernalis TaxID=3075600 RepID=A0ABU2Y1W4_9FLAO|nr:hypothetical protein [Urechidicola sp. P050]MDT0552201.1 hypothetical protein [Urechidicola sp. P050]